MAAMVRALGPIARGTAAAARLAWSACTPSASTSSARRRRCATRRCRPGAGRRAGADRGRGGRGAPDRHRDPCGVLGRAVASPELPMTPGREVAGTVDLLGPGADARWRGRRVVAHLGQANGGYAELAVRECGVAARDPRSRRAEAAVAMIGTGRTAVGILDAAALTSRGRSARHGGRGRPRRAAPPGGAQRRRARRRRCGRRRRRPSGCPRSAPTIAVDYSQPGWPERGRAGLGEREPTVVLDGVGGALGRAAMELLGPGGRLLLFGFASGSATEVTTRDLMARGLTVTWAIPRAAAAPGRPARARRRGRSPRRRRAGSSRSSGGASRSPRPPPRMRRSRRGQRRGRRCWCHDPLHLRDLRGAVRRVRGAAAELPGLRGRAPVRARGRAAVDDARRAARRPPQRDPRRGAGADRDRHEAARSRSASGRCSCRTREGNVLWDCVPLLDDDTAAEVERRGGARGHRDLAPALLLGDGRVGPALRLPGLPARRRRRVGHAPGSGRSSSGRARRRELGDGLTLIRCGGHFDGGTVLHWAAGRAAEGALLSGDIVQVVPDRRHVSFMYSYPNLIPLPAAKVRRDSRRARPVRVRDASTAPGGAR